MHPGRVIASVAAASFMAGGLAFAVVAAPAMHLGAFAPAAAAKPAASPSAKPNAAKTQAYCDAFLADLAHRLNVSVDTLKTQAKEAVKAQIDKAVANKDMTADQATKLKARIDAASGCQGLPGLVHRGGPGGERGPAFLAGLGQVMDAVATALKEPSTDQLKKDVAGGQSLSQIATAHGVSKAAVETAVRNAVTKQLDPKVTAGSMTKDQETKAADKAVAMLDRLWDKSFKMPAKPAPAATP